MGRLPLHSWLVALLALVAVVGCSSSGRQILDQAATPAALAGAPSQIAPIVSPLLDSTIHVPPSARAGQPLTILLALHGMDGNGSDFSRKLIDDADRHGWLLVAPTLNYRDFRDPEQVRRDGADLLPGLKALIDDLPNRTGLQLRPRVLIYGFSRGGQTAHRFAEFYPRSVLGVASFSCGTYTLPATAVREGDQVRPLNFPYGVGDIAQYQGNGFDAASLRQVDFWLGVGGRDNLPADVPRQWDPYLGSTRVERARSFSRAIEQLGAHVELTVFPDASHEITDQMRGQALDFLASTDQEPPAVALGGLQLP